MMRIVHQFVSENAAERRHLFDAATEAALLSRLIQAVRVGRTPADVHKACQEHIDRINSSISRHLQMAGGSSLAARIDTVRVLANTLWAVWQEDWETALQLSTKAATCDEVNAEALLLHSRILVRLKRHKEALDPALAVLAMSPHKRGLSEVLMAISKTMMIEVRSNNAANATAETPLVIGVPEKVAAKSTVEQVAAKLARVYLKNTQQTIQKWEKMNAQQRSLWRLIARKAIADERSTSNEGNLI